MPFCQRRGRGSLYSAAGVSPNPQTRLQTKRSRFKGSPAESPQQPRTSCNYKNSLRNWGSFQLVTLRNSQSTSEPQTKSFPRVSNIQVLSLTKSFESVLRRIVASDFSESYAGRCVIQQNERRSAHPRCGSENLTRMQVRFDCPIHDGFTFCSTGLQVKFILTKERVCSMHSTAHVRLPPPRLLQVVLLQLPCVQ